VKVVGVFVGFFVRHLYSCVLFFVLLVVFKVARGIWISLGLIVEIFLSRAFLLPVIKKAEINRQAFVRVTPNKVYTL
jgi:hypothetical protein